MAKAAEPLPVKLICGAIYSADGLFGQARAMLEQAFGPIDLQSPTMAFDFTDYYAEQMGGDLLRRFVSFRQLVNPGVLSSAKARTNEIEAEFARRCGGVPARPINLDPGYITEANLVLASMKNFSHRIYLGGGVYGEVTLMYHKGRWQKLPWTFPDYASGRYDDFLTKARQLLRSHQQEERR